MSRRPFAVITDQGRTARLDVLEQYAVKSQQIMDGQQSFEGFKGLLAPALDPTQLVGLLEQNTPHLVACRQKAEDVIGAGWDFVPTVEGADPLVRDRLRDWFDSPPPGAKAFDSLSVGQVLHAAAFDFEAIGRGALELVREEKDPRAPLEKVVHVPAQTLRVSRDGQRFVQVKGGRRAWFKWAGASFDLDFDSGETASLGTLRPARRANEIVWWRNYHPKDPIYGLPDVIPAIGAIVGDLSRRDFNLEFFSNFGVPAYLVTVTGDFDPGDPVDKDGEPDPQGMSPLEWELERRFGELRSHPHSTLTLVLPTRGDGDGEKVEVKIEPLATDVREASFRLYRKDNREEVLSSHRMSAAVAGVFDQGVANREARTNYKQSVILPRRAALERVVNEFIVSTFGAGWAWKVLPLDSREEDHELDMLVRMHELGAVSTEEVRLRIAGRWDLDPTKLPARPDDEVAVALRSMRDDLVQIATKNGHRELVV